VIYRRQGGVIKEANRAFIIFLGQHNYHEVPVLVTHKVNIAALTGVCPSSGEIVVVHFPEDGWLDLVGNIRSG
jgi:hypothetical protein